MRKTIIVVLACVSCLIIGTPIFASDEFVDELFPELQSEEVVDSLGAGETDEINTSYLYTDEIENSSVYRGAEDGIDNNEKIDIVSDYIEEEVIEAKGEDINAGDEIVEAENEATDINETGTEETVNDANTSDDEGMMQQAVGMETVAQVSMEKIVEPESVLSATPQLFMLQKDVEVVQNVPDSEPIKTGWEEVYNDGECLGKVYRDANGNIVIGQRYIDGYWYFFDPETGYMAQDTRVNLTASQNREGPKTCYYDADGHMIYKQKNIDGYWYMFRPGDGAMVKDALYTHDKNTNPNGGVKSCYYDADGHMIYKQKNIGGYWYMFRPGDGAMVKDALYTHDKNTNPSGGVKSCYYDADGHMIYKQKNIGGYWYMFRPGDGAMVRDSLYMHDKKTNPSGGTKTCYYDADGHMIYKQKNIGGYWYMFRPGDGAMVKDVLYTHNKNTNPSGGEKTCYYDSNGHMVYGEQVINGISYNFSKESGALLKDRWNLFIGDSRTCCLSNEIAGTHVWTNYATVDSGWVGNDRFIAQWGGGSTSGIVQSAVDVIEGNTNVFVLIGRNETTVPSRTVEYLQKINSSVAARGLKGVAVYFCYCGPDIRGDGTYDIHQFDEYSNAVNCSGVTKLDPWDQLGTLVASWPGHADFHYDGPTSRAWYDWLRDHSEQTYVWIKS